MGGYRRQGKSGKGSGSWGKGGKGYYGGKSGKGGAPFAGKGQSSEHLKKVEWGDRYAKWSLRPFAGPTGNALGNLSTPEQEVLMPASIDGAFDETSSEYKRRQGYALSMGAGTFKAGADTLLKAAYVDPAKAKFAKDNEEASEVFSKFLRAAQTKGGKEELAEMLKSREGQEFLGACRYLDSSTEGSRRDEAGVRSATNAYIEFLTTDVEAKQMAFQKLSVMSSRLYLFAMEGLEATALLARPKSMAVRVAFSTGAEAGIAL